jgi:sodium transport system permease protein
MSAIGTLLKKELTDSLRDRRTLLLMLVVPIFLYPALMLAITEVMRAGKARLAGEWLTVGLRDERTRALTMKGVMPPNTTFAVLSREEGEAALRDKRIGAYLDAEGDLDQALAERRQARVFVLYTRRNERSMEARDRLVGLLRGVEVSLLKERLEALRLPRTFAEPLKVAEVDVELADMGPVIASRLLAIVLLTMLFLGAFYPAIDVTAGEKERGTLETLLVAPVRPVEVMVAKYLTVAAIATLATVVNLGAMASTFTLGLSLGPGRLSLTLGAGQMLQLVLCLVPAAFMVSGLALVVASLARSFKEAQSLMSPVMMLILVPAVAVSMPGMELSAATALVPLLNVALLVKAVVLGTAQWEHVGLTFVSVATCSAAAVALAANAFSSESLRFGGAESWRDLFRFSPPPPPRTR